jgi:glycosyltransferase involved in cell wall biosynthesis
VTEADLPVPLLSVIVPAFNAKAVLPHALEALAASDLPRTFWELIVVDDGSTDETPSIAAEFADVVIRLSGRPHGPSYARNRGVEVARGEIVVFIDSDVCVHPDTLRRFAWKFADEPSVDAAFGSYDDDPYAPGLVSQYRNLFHHYVHQHNAGDAETFWAGCGAVRRSAFIAVGMYNEWQFSRPQVEDIELGRRLNDSGHRIVLCPEIQGKHLKRWTLRTMLLTDIKDRGVPWSRLLLKRGETIESKSLNLKIQEKVNTAAVLLAFLVALGSLVTLDSRWLGLAFIFLLPVLISSLPLYAYFARCRGIGFALAVIPLHLAYYGVNGASVLFAIALHQLVGEPLPSATVQAFSEVGVLKWPPVPRAHHEPGPPEKDMNERGTSQP